MTPDGVTSCIQRAAAALEPGAAPLTTDAVDARLTECAGIQLCVMAEIRRIERRLQSAYETASAGLGRLAQTRRLADRGEELAALRLRLSRLMGELRKRRDRLATGPPPQRRAD